MSNINLGISQSRGYENVNLINIENKNGIAVVSSRVVAKDFDKQHSHVLRDIENIISNMVDEFGNPKLDRQMFIESTYENRGKQYKEYLLTRDGFSLLVMGFTGKEALQWKLQYIEAFNRMEEYIKQQQSYEMPKMTLEEIMIAQLQEQQRIKQQQAVIEQQVQTVEQRMTNFEENSALDPGEYSLVCSRVSSRVHAVLKERGINREHVGELFKALNRDIKEITGVKTRTQLRKRHLDMVLDFINDWQPSRATMITINQMSLGI